MQTFKFLKNGVFYCLLSTGKWKTSGTTLQGSPKFSLKAHTLKMFVIFSNFTFNISSDNIPKWQIFVHIHHQYSRKKADSKSKEYIQYGIYSKVGPTCTSIFSTVHWSVILAILLIQIAIKSEVSTIRFKQMKPSDSNRVFRNWILQNHERTKNPVAKCYPHLEVNLGLLTFVSCMLLSELILLSAGSLSPLDPYVVMLYWFQKSPRIVFLSSLMHGTNILSDPSG